MKKCKKIINLQPNFINVLQNFSSSAYGEIYNVGLNMFLDNPITGVGISNYQTSCINISEYKQLMINYDCASHPHNLYVQWLSEGGIITFVSFWCSPHFAAFPPNFNYSCVFVFVSFHLINLALKFSKLSHQYSTPLIC